MTLSQEEKKVRNLEAVRKYQAKNLEIVKERRARYVATHKEELRATYYRYIAKKGGAGELARERKRLRPEVMRVRNAFSAAIHRGKIKKPKNCEGCKRPHERLEGHHHKGYAWDNRYDVIWLCRICHVKAEKEKPC